MNAFTLLTVIAGIGTIASYAGGVAATLRHGEFGCGATLQSYWRGAFDFCVFVTILSALSSL